MALNKSLGAKYTKAASKIKSYLKEKGVYEPTYDFQIDELVFNLKLADDTKANILSDGPVIISPSTGDVKQNPSVTIYMNCVKNITAIATKLGINVQERSKLKLTSESVDELEDALR